MTSRCQPRCWTHSGSQWSAIRCLSGRQGTDRTCRWKVSSILCRTWTWSTVSLCMPLLLAILPPWCINHHSQDSSGKRRTTSPVFEILAGMSVMAVAAHTPSLGADSKASLNMWWYCKHFKRTYCCTCRCLSSEKCHSWFKIASR